MGQVVQAGSMRRGDEIVVKGRRRWLIEHFINTGRISIAVGHTERGHGEKFVLRVLSTQEMEVIRADKTS